MAYKINKSKVNSKFRGLNTETTILSPSRLRCFVAMAFGHDETDKVYDRIILPTLKNKNITPVRVDRQEYLGDINNRIISELKKCDFAIADLTFARPSVYYEAGFAERTVPVVYTSRRDHLHPKHSDKFGNFKIHFDLQMRNVIPWSNESDFVFARRLDRRINYAIRPLVHTKQMQKLEQREIEAFLKLSIRARVQHILEVSRSSLVMHKFQIFSSDTPSLNDKFSLAHLNDSYPSVRDRRDVLVEDIGTLKYGWVARKFSKKAINAVLVHVAPSLGVRDIRELGRRLLRSPIYDINPSGSTKKLVEHLALCSFNKVPVSRVQTCLKDFGQDKQHEELVWTKNQLVPSNRLIQFKEIYPTTHWGGLTLVGLTPSNRIEALQIDGWRILRYRRSGKSRHIGYLRQIPRHMHIRLFDNIRSEKSFTSRFSEWMQKIEIECK